MNVVDAQTEWIDGKLRQKTIGHSYHNNPKDTLWGKVFLKKPSTLLYQITFIGDKICIFKPDLLE